MAHIHADGSEEFRERSIEEQVAAQNQRAALVSNGEIRMLMGTWRERGGDRRMRDRGCSLIGEQRRKTERRAA